MQRISLILFFVLVGIFTTGISSSVKAQTTDCSCRKGMTKLWLLYEGDSPAHVVVYRQSRKRDKLLDIQSVGPGQLLLVDASSTRRGKLGVNTYIYLNQHPHTSIHTSCSKPIQGQSFGLFKVLAFEDGQSSTCSAPLDFDLLLQGNCHETAGKLYAHIKGGLPPFSYLWSNGATTPYLDNLAPGTYSLTITDATGHSQTRSASIESASQPLSITATSFACNCQVGKLSVQVSGGTPPYQYRWFDQQNVLVGDKATLSNIVEGQNYRVQVIDANGCQESIVLGCPSSSCNCRKGIVRLQLQYKGDTPTDIRVYEDSKKQKLIHTFPNTQPNDILVVEGNWFDKGKLKANTYFEANGQTIQIHTSCSQPILGLQFGSLLVLGHTDGESNECQLSPVDDCNHDGDEEDEGGDDGDEDDGGDDDEYQPAFRAYMYPNPATDFFTLEVDAGRPDQTYQVQIMNQSGRKIGEFTIQADASGFIRHNIPSYNLAEGFYIVHIQSSEGAQSVRLLIKK